MPPLKLLILIAAAVAVQLAVVGAFSEVSVAAALELSPTGQPAEYFLGFDPPELAGFDGVTFGMTMEEVESLAAELYPNGVREWAEDPVNLTPLLHVTLDALAPVPGVPGLGPAGITYVFGAESQRLIAINLNWYIGGGRDATPEEREALLALGTEYVSELLQYMWDPIHVLRGLVIGPNAVILFAGRDWEGRGVEVAVDGVPLDVIIMPDEIEEHRPVESGPVRLRIGLAARPDDPDVFTLEPGSF